jgi:hypothetical protein
MTKDTTSHHVWRVLMMCLALGSGALFIAVGYMFGARLATGPVPATPAQQQSGVATNQPATSEPTAIKGSIFENGGSVADKLNVAWAAATEQQQVALPFTIPGAKEGERLVTSNVTTGTRLGTARDARGQEWQVVAVDVVPYNEMGGLVEGAYDRYLFANKGDQWTEIPQGMSTVVTTEAWVAMTGTREPKTLRQLMYQRLATAAGWAQDTEVDAWLFEQGITESRLWIPEFSLAKMIAAPNGVPALVRSVHYLAQGELLAEIKKLPVVASSPLQRE